jgi:hypothetical protein
VELNEPSIQRLHSIAAMSYEDPDEECKNRFPDAKLKLMHEINDEHGEYAETIFHDT